MNDVDDSAAAVERELAEIEAELGGDDRAAVEAAGAEAVKDVSAEKGMALMMVVGGLKFSVEGVAGVVVSDDNYNSLGVAAVDLIYKYFPDGIFEFLAAYKEELAVLGAGFGFYRAVVEAKKKSGVEGEDGEGVGGVVRSEIAKKGGGDGAA